MVNNARIIVSLDYPAAEPALALVDRLDPGLCHLKIGKELFTRSGPSLVEKVQKAGFSVFLDLKFHDIPNTVASACRAAADLGVWMVNVHASGGSRMIGAAREAIDKTSGKPLLIAVTVLTSMSGADLIELGINNGVEQQVLRLAKLAAGAGADGVVCSAQEVTPIRQMITTPFCLVTPGIRPRGADANDQQRIVTPGDAISLGSDYLVIGRPITQAPDPLIALQQIQLEVDGALQSR